MNAGDTYELGIGLMWILGGVCLFLVLRGYLPLRPNEEKLRAAEAWRRKFGTLAYFLGRWV